MPLIGSNISSSRLKICLIFILDPLFVCSVWVILNEGKVYSASNRRTFEFLSCLSRTLLCFTLLYLYLTTYSIAFFLIHSPLHGPTGLAIIVCITSTNCCMSLVRERRFPLSVSWSLPSYPIQERYFQVQLAPKRVTHSCIRYEIVALCYVFSFHNFL